MLHIVHRVSFTTTSLAGFSWPQVLRCLLAICSLENFFPQITQRVDQPPLNPGVSLLMESQAVSSVCGKATVGKTALQQFHLPMTSLVSFQVTRVPKPTLTLGANIRLSRSGGIGIIAFYIHYSPLDCQLPGVICTVSSHISNHIWHFYVQGGSLEWMNEIEHPSLFRAWLRSSRGRLRGARGPSGSSKGRNQTLFSCLALL